MSGKACSMCGEPLSPQANFCRLCGGAAQPSDSPGEPNRLIEPNYCERCGQRITRKHFDQPCPKCGAPIRHRTGF